MARNGVAGKMVSAFQKQMIVVDRANPERSRSDLKQPCVAKTTIDFVFKSKIKAVPIYICKQTWKVCLERLRMFPKAFNSKKQLHFQDNGIARRFNLIGKCSWYLDHDLTCSRVFGGKPQFRSRGAKRR